VCYSGIATTIGAVIAAFCGTINRFADGIKNFEEALQYINIRRVLWR